MSLGTIWGRQAPSCFGAQEAIAPSIWIEACLVLHLDACRPARTLGMMIFTPGVDNLAMIVRLGNKGGANKNMLEQNIHV